MNTNQLRSKLKEQGLNSQGDFEMLKARLQKLVILEHQFFIRRKYSTASVIYT